MPLIWGLLDDSVIAKQEAGTKDNANTSPIHSLNLCHAIGSIEGIPDLSVHNDLAFGEASLNGALARFPKARQHLQ